MHATSLSLILPCYNEEENITSTVSDITTWFASAGITGEIIAVNDGSKDRTGQILEELRRITPVLRVLQHDRNRGYASALVTGLDAGTMEVLAFMDSDGQFRAAELALLLPRLAEAPFVAGRRRKRADPVMRILTAKFSGMLVWLMLGIWVRDINCGLKVFRRELWPAIRPTQVTGALFNTEVFLRLRQHKISWTQIPVPHYPRLHGRQTGGSPMVLLRAIQELWKLRTSN
ncbi:MAG: cell wall biosynthesis glycosyltransferase [Candidatus Peregrinibacteria bacterium Greene0416_19]|nr:MAG: cell wall biosynthesis glycosyltransferase [Candidatus Peregrinibacteria bacterium Greene0416_19]